ncbi:hypothetical protein [Leptospira sp. GIMC2001]|uniref:hypothetical protein n=1 Tax=Leptospira sp. GIMC2001 TaxID=1513297 RepID=UPI00234C029B|nr:hypothetical protein [Leptospira sp. GIMC2001]WCL51508.1 hypothetical protein O4O04_20035 [Leptospira sp. GIMC2001]
MNQYLKQIITQIITQIKRRILILIIKHLKRNYREYIVEDKAFGYSSWTWTHKLEIEINGQEIE